MHKKWIMPICTFFFWIVIASNVFGAAPITVTIPVSCSSPRVEKHTIALKKNGEEITTTSIAGNGKSALEITYTEPGTYDYTLTKNKGRDLALTYDETEYQVTVFVGSKENGELYSQAVLYKTGSKTKDAMAEFKDSWDPNYRGDHNYHEGTTETEVTSETEEHWGETKEDPNRGGSGNGTTAGSSVNANAKTKTGDDTPLFQLIALMTGATLCMIVIRRKEQSHNE